MRRIGHENGVMLYDIICSTKNIEEAMRAAVKAHGHDRDAIWIMNNWNEARDGIQNILRSRSFHYSRFISRDIVERGKKRHLLYTRTYPDRVIQHAVAQVVGPILLSTCPACSYAAQPGKGIHRCMHDVENFIKTNRGRNLYYLKTDIRRYFDSVDRSILFRQIQRKIKCSRTLDILHRMIFEVPGRRGMAIGLYISQIFASFHLASVALHVSRSYKCFLYMDDLVVFSESKEALHTLRRRLATMLSFELRLHMKDDWCVRPLRDGLDFVGYVFFPTHTRLRKRVKSAYKKVCHVYSRNPSEHALRAVRSYEGMMSHADCIHLAELSAAFRNPAFCRNVVLSTRDAHRMRQGIENEGSREAPPKVFSLLGDGYGRRGLRGGAV